GHTAHDARHQEHPRRGHVVVENLLHQPHRRFVISIRDHERRQREHHRAHDGGAYEPLRHQSVITASKVHNDKVRNTASNAIRSTNHTRTTPPSTSGCSSAAVPRTPAMMTGTVIGY